MGTRVDNAGITVQLYDDRVQPQGDPYFGRYAHLRGRQQDEVVRAGAARSGQERDEPGSDDWLTLVAVADTPDRLAAILRDTTVPPTEPHSSHSSRRVLIEVHVGDTRKTFENRVAIASGPIVQLPPDPIIDVVHVKVLAEGTKMDDSHPLIGEFRGGARALSFK
jgi:hypothetical protein